MDDEGELYEEPEVLPMDDEGELCKELVILGDEGQLDTRGYLVVKKCNFVGYFTVKCSTVVYT